MLRYEDKAIRRELKSILGSAAGMLYITGLTEHEICGIVRDTIYTAAMEMEAHAQATKDKGGN